MDWPQIREHYRREFLAANTTQQQVAAAAGLNQSAISKLLSNDQQGPATETFVRAVEGLGISAAEFFARLDRPAGGVPEDRGPARASAGQALILDTVIAALQRAKADAGRRPGRRRRR